MSSQPLPLPLHEVFVCKNDIALPEKPLLQPFQQDHYFFFLVKKGEGHPWIDFIQRDWKPGGIYFTGPRNRLLFEDRMPLAGTLLAFTEGFLQTLEQPVWKSLPVLLDPQEIHELEPSGEEADLLNDLLIRMEAGYAQHEDKEKDGFLSSFHGFLICLSRIYTRWANTASLSHDPWMMAPFKELLYEKYDPLRPVEDYAQILDTTIPSLNRVVREQTGKTLDALLEERLILEAKYALSHSDLSIKEIAISLGFDDAGLTRRFKRGAGLTPAAFRANLPKTFQNPS